ncbi:hypothetical protein IDH13_03260 [Pelagibacterales bacterium SAG-MED34]|nr:hypothetical protein [Pelagibacterales bacterium SAG-MED34]
MSKETITYTENNFEPLNKAIDQSIKEQRSRTIWRYAKVIALILVSIGILAVLLAWAYSIYKKPNPELVRKIDEVNKRFEQSQRIDKNEEKIVEGVIVKYNSTTQRFLTSNVDGISITTRVTYSKTKDLLEGNTPKKVTCYLQKGVINFEFDEPLSSQQEALNIIGISLKEANSYKKYCKYNTR